MREPRVDVTAADGTHRRRIETGHTRELATIFGHVQVARLAYRTPGQPNLHPADAMLNLPAEKHSHGLRHLAAIEATRGSFDDAVAAISRSTGQQVGKRRLEDLAHRSAVDFDDFYTHISSSEAAAASPHDPRPGGGGTGAPCGHSVATWSRRPSPSWSLRNPGVCLHGFLIGSSLCARESRCMSSELGERGERPTTRDEQLIGVQSGGRYGEWLSGRTVLAGVAALGVVVLIAGCGAASSAGTTGTGASSAPGSSASAAQAAGAATPDPNVPDPNAPEVNAAGDIPDNQVFVPFTPPGGAFSVSVPQGWVQSADGAATVFTDKFNSVRVEGRPLPVAPDPGSVRAQDVPQLQGSVPGFVLGDVQTVQRSAGTVVLLTYGATSAPNAVTGKSVTEAVERYAFWRGGQEVVLTLSGPKGADNVDPWQKISDSFRWQQ